MATKVMFNYLELAYSPISNYVFSLIKDDPRFRTLTEKSTLYIIGQRAELTFENLRFEDRDNRQFVCLFDIKQKGNQSVLACELPIYQQNLASESSKVIKFQFEYASPKPNPIPNIFPQYNIVNLLLTDQDSTFIGWLSPENFIQNCLNGAIRGKINGPVEEFIKYRVHYVGKATEQNVWKRLTGHSTLQEILSLQYPLHFGTLPTHEIAILFLKFREAFKIDTISAGEKITNDLVDSLLSKNLPNGKIISLDAEKAFINAMQPKYNKEFYRNYPKSKDGLYAYHLDSYSFRIHSYLTLEYENGTIEGCPSLVEGDAVVIEKNQPVKVFKLRS